MILRTVPQVVPSQLGSVSKLHTGTSVTTSITGREWHLGFTAIQSYQYLRDGCSWRLLNVDSPLLLGGPGIVIQIDESLSSHKPKEKYE